MREANIASKKYDKETNMKGWKKVVTIAVLVVAFAGIAGLISVKVGVSPAKADAVSAAPVGDHISISGNADPTEEPTASPTPLVKTQWDQQQALLLTLDYGWNRIKTPRGEYYFVERFVDPSTNVDDFVFYTGVVVFRPSRDGTKAVQAVVIGEQLTRQQFFDRAVYTAPVLPADFTDMGDDWEIVPGYGQ